MTFKEYQPGYIEKTYDVSLGKFIDVRFIPEDNFKNIPEGDNFQDIFKDTATKIPSIEFECKIIGSNQFLPIEIIENNNDKLEWMRKHYQDNSQIIFELSHLSNDNRDAFIMSIPFKAIIIKNDRFIGYKFI